jgi:membrane-associated phospholipid phosphatase
MFRRGIFYTGLLNALYCLLLAAGVFFVSDIYSLLNHGPGVIFLKSPLDDFLPVVKVFVVPYVSLDVCVYATLLVFLFTRTGYFQSAALCMIFIFLISYMFYFFLQSYIDRPVISGSDIFSRMILEVYRSDSPYNDFPSLHTSISTILAIHWYRLDRRIGIPASIWAALIVLSTVLIKQHYIADLAGGLALAFLAGFLSRKIFKGNN